MYLPRKSLNYVALHAIWNQKACNTVHYAEQKTLGAKKLLYTMVWAMNIFPCHKNAMLELEEKKEIPFTKSNMRTKNSFGWH